MADVARRSLRRRIQTPAMRLLGVIAVIALLAGCTLVPPLAAVEGVSVIGTDKTFTDHVVSLSSGKHCSTLRTQADLSYCEEDENTAREPRFCYRTLGDVVCYDRPDPYRGRHQAVDEVDFIPAR